MVERSFDVPVQCPHDTDARKHRRTVERRDQDQGFYCSLPFRRCVFDLRKSRNVVAGVLKRDQPATAGQGIGSSKMRDQANQYTFADPGASLWRVGYYLASRLPQRSQRIRAPT
jgi:hypothetical protein